MDNQLWINVDFVLLIKNAGIHQHSHLLTNQCWQWLIDTAWSWFIFFGCANDCWSLASWMIICTLRRTFWRRQWSTIIHCGLDLPMMVVNFIIINHQKAFLLGSFLCKSLGDVLQEQVWRWPTFRLWRCIDWWRAFRSSLVSRCGVVTAHLTAWRWCSSILVGADPHRENPQK